MISVLFKADESMLLTPSSLDANHSAGWAWIDVFDPTPEEILDLADRLSIDPLVVEDILDRSVFPKVDAYGDFLFCVLHSRGQADDRLTTVAIDILVWKHTLVTVHQQRVTAIDWVADHCQTTPAMAEGGPDRMFARIAEVQGRNYLPLLDELDDRIEELEIAGLHGDPMVIADVQRLRSDAGRLRRVISPQREVFLTLTQEESEVIGTRAARRFSSVYDHHHRMVESLDAGRGLLSAIMDTYRSTVAERTNEVMKVLTVYAAILLPLSLLAGLYGMNFGNMPELRWRWGYFALLGVMATVAVGQAIYFARRGFIGRWRIPAAPRAVGRGLGMVARAPLHILSGLLLSGRDDDG